MTRFHRLTLAALVLAAVTARPAPAAPAVDGQVVALSLVASPGRAELIVNVRGSVTVRDFMLSNPSRLVLDLAGATLTTPAEPIYDGVARAGIVNVRVKQYSAGVVRVVLELDHERSYTVEQDGESVRVSFGADQTFLAWSTGTPAASLSSSAASTTTEASYVAAMPSSRPVPVRTVPTQRAEPRITVTWDKADINDVISGFSALSGRTIILGKGVTGTLTAEIRDKPWSQAFQAILASQGLSAQEMPGGIIRVDAPQSLAELDSLEPLETSVVRVNYVQAPSIANSIKGILTKNRGNIVADTATNSLIVTETKSRLASVVEFAKGLDIRTPQVSIQAKIIFVDRTDIEELGFKYDLGTKDQFFNKLVQRPDPNGEPGETYNPNVNVVDLGGGTVSAIANAERTISQSAIDLIFSTALGGFTLTTFLTALERVELSDVQAEPLITTLDNKQADILVGEEVPVRIVDYASTGAGQPPRATVEFKQTGIRLTVTPHVTNNRQVLMKLYTERSQVKTLSNADLGYTIDKQTSENMLLVNDGETAVIGGLTVTSVQRNRSGIPLLSSLPLIGNLFSFTSNTEQRRDLIILVTPRIVDEGEPNPGS
jgi:type IV pilus assembly protein PilQ